MSTKRGADANDPEVVISLRLTRWQHDGLRELAAREHRSVSQQMRFLIEAAVTADQERRAA